jgi:hypothetical protein
MVFMFSCLLFVLVSVFLLRKRGVKHPLSKGIALAIALSALATVCLAQNYTQSLIPAAEDGIGISNRVAYWLIGEDFWSVDRFRASFMNAVYVTLFLIAAYPTVLSVEAARARRRQTP